MAQNPHTHDTLSDEISEIIEEMEALRANYEQYFLGIERRPPTMRHERLKKRVVAIQTTTVRQTAAKFKAQSLNNKMLSYERLWARTIKEIETGTYTRDVYKAKLHRKDDPPAAPLPPPEPVAAPKAAAPAASAPKVAPPGPAAPGAAPARPSGPAPAAAPAATAAAAKPGAPAAPGKPTITAAKPLAPVAAAPGQLSDAKLRAVYDAYVMAKKRCNEDTSKLTYDSVANTLRSQVPALIKQHNAKSVEFKVVIKDGKAVLRALPKE